MIKVASLFDGIGGTLLSATMCGIEPVWASEIEPFPIKVTKHHFPNVKHLGDITKINGAEVEPVDIIVGGSPCQDLSVAGKRAGMKHAEFGDEETTRSGLFMEQIRIVKEMRNATNKPRYMVWENVPGAFSSNDGEDFRAVLEETARVADPTVSIPRFVNGWANAGSILADGFTISWRTFDAQYWGVPQRRRRIYLVADFGGQSAPEILFEQPCLHRNFAESRSKGQGTAEDVERRTDTPIWDIGDRRKAAVFSFDSLSSNSMKSSNPHSGCRQVEVSKCIDTTNPDPSKNQGGIAIVSEPTLIEMTSTKNTVVEDGICPTLTARMGTGGNQVNAVCSSVGGFMQSTVEKSPTLMARDYKDPHVVSQHNKQVRRLTPLECERLQGYPENWTDIPGASDSARYKALGNSFAIPNISFVIQKCVEVMRCEV